MFGIRMRSYLTGLSIKQFTKEMQMRKSVPPQKSMSNRDKTNKQNSKTNKQTNKQANTVLVSAQINILRYGHSTGAYTIQLLQF